MIKDKIIKILDSKAKNFFPKTGRWVNSCFERPNKVDEEYFPCHTRDNEWLALMFQIKFRLYFIKKDFILNYINNSELFAKERHNYEQRVVEWQIDWMKSDGENWIVDSSLGGDLYMLSPKCDLAFRKGVVDTLSKIGMNIDSIEEGIEKNANKWRPSYMHLAFSNLYSPVIFCINEKRDKLPEINPELETKWAKMRLYEYYQNHKDSVDKYGEVLPEMMMSKEEVLALKEYFDIKGNERLEEIKNNRNHEFIEEKRSITNELNKNKKRILKKESEC